MCSGVLRSRKAGNQMRVAGRFVAAVSAMVATQLFAAVPAVPFHQDPPLDPEPPFVICENQRYALCAAASCFVYNGVAYCQCDVLKGDSISLQPDAVKGGSGAVYTCPGMANAGSGMPAPVAYGQCDGGLCFTSTTNKT